MSGKTHDDLSLHRRPKCEECGVYGGHGVDCSKLTFEDCRQMVKKSWEAGTANMRNAQYEINRMREMVTLWQGKFHMLRHENNKLRQENERSSHLQPVMDEMFHDFKLLRDALGCDGSDLPQLLAAIQKLKDFEP